MRVSTILTLDRIDFDAIFPQINLNLSRKLYAPLDFRTSLRGKDSAPSILRLFILPPANVRQSFASRVPKNLDFSCYSSLRGRRLKGKGNMAGG